jgi:hypothetical protein
MSKNKRGVNYKASEDTNVSANYQGKGNGLKSKLTSIDAFGQPVNEFNYQGSTTYKSCYGGLTTLISVALLVIMLGVKINEN